MPPVAPNSSEQPSPHRAAVSYVTQSEKLCRIDLMTAAESLSWSGASGVGDDLVQSFLQQSHASVDLNHQTSLSGAEVAKLLSEFWDWSNIREGKEPLIRTRRVSSDEGAADFTLLEIVGEDMPFLVRSVLGACRDRSMKVANTAWTSSSLLLQ